MAKPRHLLEFSKSESGWFAHPHSPVIIRRRAMTELSESARAAMRERKRSRENALGLTSAASPSTPPNTAATMHTTSDNRGGGSSGGSSNVNRRPAFFREALDVRGQNSGAGGAAPRLQGSGSVAEHFDNDTTLPKNDNSGGAGASNVGGATRGSQQNNHGEQDELARQTAEVLRLEEFRLRGGSLDNRLATLSAAAAALSYARKEAAAAGSASGGANNRDANTGSGLFDESYGYPYSGAYDLGPLSRRASMENAVSGSSADGDATTGAGPAVAANGGATIVGAGAGAGAGASASASAEIGSPRGLGLGSTSTSPLIPEEAADGYGSVAGGGGATGGSSSSSTGTVSLLDYTDDSSYTSAAAAAATAAAAAAGSPSGSSGGGQSRSTPIAIGSPASIDLLSPAMGGYDAYTTDDDGDGDDGGVGVGIDGDFEGAHNTARHSGGNGDNWRGGLSGAGRLSHGNSDDSDIAAADGWTLIEKPEEGPAGGPATISTTEVPMPEGAGTPTTASTPAPAAVYPTIKLAPQHTWERDRDHVKCQECETPFTFVKRRHHCRACGHVACAKCAPYRLPAGHKEKIRLCKLCALQF